MCITLKRVTETRGRPNKAFGAKGDKYTNLAFICLLAGERKESRRGKQNEMNSSEFELTTKRREASGM